MSVINTNIKALVAQDSMVKNNRSLSTAMERLSTGSRINTAADDAAGLSITTRMDAQVRGLSQAIRNANDGISIVQTTEGALEEVTSMLQRMRELAVQSVNDSNNADDRAALEAEVLQLKTEIDRVASTTQWNNMNVLDGSFKNKVLQIGDKANQTMALDVASVKTEDLGTGSTSINANTIVSARVDFDAGGTIAAGTDDDDIPAGAILINNTALRAFTGAQDDLGDIIEDINAKVSGVRASGFNTVVADQVGSGVLANGGLVFSVTPLSTANAAGTASPTAVSFSISASRSLDELVQNINNEAGGLVQASLSSEGKLQLSNDTGATIEITTAGANSGFSATGKFQGFLKLESTSGDPVTVTKGNLSSATAATLNSANTLAKLGLRETVKIDSRDGNTIRGSAITSPTTAWASGDLKINGVDMYDPLISTTTFQGKIDTINRFTNETGVQASAYTSVVYSWDAAADVVAAEEVRVNGITNTTDLADASITTFVSAVNAISGQTGVKATQHGNNILFEGNVASINLAMVKTDGTVVGTGTLFGAPTLAGVTTNGGLQLDSVDNKPISIQLASAKDLNARLNTGNTQADNATTAFGLLEQNVGAADFDVNAATVGPLSALAISKVSVASSALASKAIGSIDKAIEQVSAQRSQLGAIENRLEKTVNNLSNIVTNTAQSRSRIKDTDYAVETTNLAKAQIIQQAATAMLAQANQQPQSVLALLQ